MLRGGTRHAGTEFDGNVLGTGSVDTGDRRQVIDLVLVGRQRVSNERVVLIEAPTSVVVHLELVVKEKARANRSWPRAFGSRACQSAALVRVGLHARRDVCIPTIMRIRPDYDSTNNYTAINCWKNGNGRGGIRTHAGLHPHDFQSCALSHSATRPESTGRFDPAIRYTDSLMRRRVRFGSRAPAVHPAFARGKALARPTATRSAGRPNVTEAVWWNQPGVRACPRHWVVTPASARTSLASSALAVETTSLAPAEFIAG